MPYVAETRLDIRILEITEIKVLRKIANRSLRERTRTEEISRVYKVYNISGLKIRKK